MTLRFFVSLLSLSQRSAKSTFKMPATSLSNAFFLSLRFLASAANGSVLSSVSSPSLLNAYLNDLGKEKFEEKIAKSIKRFYDLGILEKLEDAEGEDYLSLEELRSFYYSGVKIYIKIDFAIKRDGLVYLYDWKTGRESYQDRLQLQAYAFYAQKSWGVEYSAIRLYPVYLTQDDFSLKAIANISPQELTDYIDKSLKAMKERLVDVDNNQAVIDNFVPQRQQYRCRHCFFKELCFPPSSL